MSKPTKIKPHRTVKLTIALLRRLGACSPGVENIRPFLPVTISTNPLDNLAFADEFCNTLRCYDVSWLVERTRDSDLSDHIGWSELNVRDGETMPEDQWRSCYREPMICAQLWAIAADNILSKRGR